jgi:hypothetical protein
MSDQQLDLKRAQSVLEEVKTIMNCIESLALVVAKLCQELDAIHSGLPPLVPTNGYRAEGAQTL